MSRRSAVKLYLVLFASYALVLPVCSGGGGGGGGGSTGSEPGQQAYRAIAGVSMGGYGALNLGTKPNRIGMFRAIGSMGGPVDLWQLIADIRDENLEVKRTVGIPVNVGDDFTFDKLPPYPSRGTRIGFTKDLVLAFGNPLLHHPDPAKAYLASDSQPAAIKRDDVWGPIAPFNIPVDPRGFRDGGDADEDGLRQISENAPGEYSDALLAATGSLLSAFGVVGTDVGGRMLADEDADNVYDLGDGIVVNLSEPFTDLPGGRPGRYDAGEPFDDFGLDGVDLTVDFGERNARFDEDPDIANWLAQDPLTRIQGMTREQIQRVRIYMDVGDGDELGFGKHYTNLVNVLTGKGLAVERLGDDGDDDCTVIPSIDGPYTLMTYQGGHVGFDDAQLLDDLRNANVCGATAIWQRLIHLLVAMDDAFPDGVRGAIRAGDIIVRDTASPALATGGGAAPIRRVVIYRPPAFFSTELRLPVLYFLGGHGQKPDDYDRMDLLMNLLITARVVQNMFVVFLPGEGGTEGSFYVNHAVGENQVPDLMPAEITSGRYEASIFDDLIPVIEGTYLRGRVR